MQLFIIVHVFERNGRRLQVALTEHLRIRCRKGKVWKSKAFLTALKNAEYGFDEQRARSRGGQDGIFLLDRNFTPPNTMMYKILDQYLDRPDKGLRDIASSLQVSILDFKPVRLVSHNIRLLGVLWQAQNFDLLILVDFDA